MFLFIGGALPRTVRVDEVERLCPRCGRPAFRLKRTDSYLSLFFIPLFPIKRGEPYLVCENCGYEPEEPQMREPDAAPQMSRRCPRCRRALQVDFRYCPACGAPLGDDWVEKA